MRRLIVLLDGTWNEPENDTDSNIVRLRRIIVDYIRNGREVVPQSTTRKSDRSSVLTSPQDILYYERGVGTAPLERLKGGAVGYGLEMNIRRAYRFLSHHFLPGDKIFLFGFSRGAYTARSLAGFMHAAGLLRSHCCTPELEEQAWRLYRTPPNERLSGSWNELQRYVHSRNDVRVDCLGVFDTVGALGIPIRLGWRFNRARHEFHDVEMSSISALNIQALAIDEHRFPFQATLWRKPMFKRLDSRTEQVWFPGSHADVGGGWIPEERRSSDHVEALDDITLDWMLKRVKKAHEDFPVPERSLLPFETGSARAPQHDARQGLYKLQPKAFRSIANRPVPLTGPWRREVGRDRHASSESERIHISSIQRLGEKVKCSGKWIFYAPKTLLSEFGRLERIYDGQFSNNDTWIVDWNSEALNPNNPPDRLRAAEQLALARQRLMNANRLPP